MFCKNCGKELLDGAAFCHGCGAAAPAPNTESEKPEATCNTTEEKVTYTAPETNKETVPPIYQIPQYTAPAEENVSDKKGFSLTSLILGICSFLPCCCVNFITAILAVVFGIIGIKSSNRTLSIVGIILAGAAFIIYAVLFVVYALVLETNTEDFSYFFGNNMQF